MISKTAQTGILQFTAYKLQAWAAFAKMRLTLLVVFSSVVGYAIGAESFSFFGAFWLAVSGFLVTGSSNGFNQILEKDLDALMKRTSGRPIPTGAMSVREGLILASVMGIAGLILLFFLFNTLAAVLGALALFSYVFIYTPLKRITPLAVFAGAFPGAIPPMLGYVAATGTFDLTAGLLFALQFVWQFPHFWSIAWVVEEDYSRAGYRLLPSAGGKDGRTAFLTLLYTLFLIPVGLLPWAFSLMGTTGAVLLSVAAVLFAMPCVSLLLQKTDKAARKVMFSSFIYLPVVLLIWLIDKI